MKRYLIVLMLYIFVGNVFSQKCENCNFQKELSMMEANLLMIHTIPINLPPLKDDFFQANKGLIIINNVDSVDSKIFRYDGVTDNIILNRNNEYFAVDKRTVSEFYINFLNQSKKYHFKKIRIKNYLSSEVNDSYLQVLYEGSNSLYVLRKCKFSKTSNSLIADYVYFIKDENNIFHSFQSIRKRKFLNIIINKDQIANIINENKLKIKNETQMVDALKLIDKKHQ